MACNTVGGGALLLTEAMLPACNNRRPIVNRTMLMIRFLSCIMRITLLQNLERASLINGEINRYFAANFRKYAKFASFAVARQCLQFLVLLFTNKLMGERCKQVLKVIREQRVAPRRIKRIANYRFCTPLE